MSDDFVYGICPECGHAYTEPINDFEHWLPPGCPHCGSKREPYPVRDDDDLPPPPDLYPVSIEEFYAAPKTTIFIVLLRDVGYRLGLWVSGPTSAPLPAAEDRSEIRFFAVGASDGSKMALSKDTIVAAWRVGDRPGHHG